jgi:hypothetical protein
MKREPEMKPLLISVMHCSQLLNLGRTKTLQLLKRGEIESVKIDRRRLPILRSVEALVEKLRQQANEEAE